MNPDEIYIPKYLVGTVNELTNSIGSMQRHPSEIQGVLEELKREHLLLVDLRESDRAKLEILSLTLKSNS